MFLTRLLEEHWRQPKPWLSLFLRPLSRLFGVLSERRRRQYVSGRLKREKLPVPVVIVGNIHVGGVGKTPVTAALAQALHERGVKVGIISRGYGRKSRAAHVLHENSTADGAGDEPLLLYRKTGVPVAVAAKRAEAGRALLAAFPEIELLLADDGLQHYALERDVEIAVVPYEEQWRYDLNVLPDGPLREPLGRLIEADAVVHSGCPQDFAPNEENGFASCVEMGALYRLNRPSEKASAADFAGLETAALAAIARPQRFFDSLADFGFDLAECRILPDHAPLSADDLPAADAVFVTEKDAVKLMPSEKTENVWVLPVCAIIRPDLADFVLRRLQELSEQTWQDEYKMKNI